MQRHLSYYFFSLTTDINRASKNPRVPAARPPQRNFFKKRDSDDAYAPGVRVLFFLLLAVSQSPFVLQLMATLKEGDHWQMWEFIRVN